jgi:hypothetical protein
VFAVAPVTVFTVGAGAAVVDGVGFGEAGAGAGAAVLGAAFGAPLGAVVGAVLGAEGAPDDPEEPAELEELGVDPAPGWAPGCASDWVIEKALLSPLAASGVVLCGLRPSSRTTPETVAVPVTIARRMEGPF